MKINDFKKMAMVTMREINECAQKCGLVGSARADHICFKCASSEEFEMMRTMLERESVYMFQSFISERRIAYFMLQSGIKSDLGNVHYVELSDQKPDGSQRSGFDHVECYPAPGVSYTLLTERLSKVGAVKEVKRPHHTTHDLQLETTIFRCCLEPLADKIKREEM
jgi:predicted metalloenzyme YecM